jgi:excisionase family DNA binding protein
VTQWFSVKELMAYSGLSRKTIYNLIYKKQIPFQRISEKRVQFDKDEIRIWLETRKLEKKPTPVIGPEIPGYLTEKIIENAQDKTALQSGLSKYINNKAMSFILGSVALIAIGGWIGQFLTMKSVRDLSIPSQMQGQSQEKEAKLRLGPAKYALKEGLSGGDFKTALDDISNIQLEGEARTNLIRPLLLSSLKNSGDYSTRSKTIDIIKPQVDDPEIKETLINIIKNDRDPAIRMKAVTALSRHIHDRDVKKAFLQRMEDEENDIVRFKILDVIAKDIDVEVIKTMDRIKNRITDKLIKSRIENLIKTVKA